MKSVRLIALVALCACLISPLLAAQARPVAAPEGDLEAAIKVARVGGKYQGLLRILRVDEDKATYGRFKEYGRWKGDTYREHTDLPAGYWVWVAPHWFIWARMVERAFGPDQALGPPSPTAQGKLDYRATWLPARFDARGLAWIELTFPKKVATKAVVIYGAHRGQITRVAAWDTNDSQYAIGPSASEALEASTSFAVLAVPETSAPIGKLKIYVNLARRHGPVAIDAVGLLDDKGSLHWAVRAEASHGGTPRRITVGSTPGGAPGAGRVLRPSAPTASTNRMRTAVEDALDWLARFQTQEKGYWDADGFHKNVHGATPEGLGYPLYDHGLTGLALLAFFGAGHTHTKGHYKEPISHALQYLKRIQDPEGCFGQQTGHFMYNHAICTLAMCEAFGLSRSPLLRRPAEKAVAFLLKAQNPNPSGQGKLAWRYTVKPGDNDSSVTAWAVMALKSAKTAGLKADFDTAFHGARVWLDQMTDAVTGRVGYVQTGVSPVRAPGREVKWPRGKSEAITAAGLATRIFLGEHPNQSKVIHKGITLLMDRPPEWSPEAGTIDPYYWYYGTLATFQVGGHAWKRWSMALTEAVVKNQRKEGPHRGSWDPLGPWGADGGRVYTTALLAMCLEVRYRYARVVGVKKPGVMKPDAKKPGVKKL